MDKRKFDPSYALMDALSVGADDLAANQDGVLSKAQAPVLRNERNRQLTIAFFRLIVALWIIYTCALSGNINLFEDPTSLFFPLVLTGMAIVFSGVPLSKGFLFHRDQSLGKVRTTEGHIRLDIIGKDKYAVFMGEEQFDVSKETFLAFKNNDPYRLYYVPFSNTLVAAEWLYDSGFFDDETEDELSDVDDLSLGNLMSSQR